MPPRFPRHPAFCTHFGTPPNYGSASLQEARPSFLSLTILESAVGIGPTFTELQSVAWPLGYALLIYTVETPYFWRPHQGSDPGLLVRSEP